MAEEIKNSRYLFKALTVIYVPRGSENTYKITLKYPI